MTGLTALQSVQFVNFKGKRLAVLSVEDWETLIEWLENIEDEADIKKALADLKAAKGDREVAGWLEWDKDEELSSPTGGDDEFEAVADELINSIASYQGLNPTILPDYAFSREGIYQDHP